jgi:hypothetical protein
MCACAVIVGGEDRQSVQASAAVSCITMQTSEAHRTNPGTEAEPQQIVAQGYSHAYSTPFHS